jgi:1,4-dihydroxy-2-naphthoate polyprenyltransferase
MKSSQAIPTILRIIRVHIVAGGALAFSLGALLAFVNGGTFDPLQIVLFYAIVFLGDLSTHYSNDYFDVNQDKYVERKKFFSGKNILGNNPTLRSSARWVSIMLFILSNALAVLMVVLKIAPLELLIITLGANFLGWAYSAPPLRLVSRGLGEVAIALAVGFAIPAVGYLAVRGQFDYLFWYFTLPFVLYGFMLALSFEAPDIEVDLKVGKLNIGARKGKMIVFVLIFAAASAASSTFLFYAYQISSIVDFRWMVLFSLAPLMAGFVWLIGFFTHKNDVNRFSTLSVLSLFLLNCLMATYLGALSFSFA